MIAFRAEARRWARYYGAPQAVCEAAALYLERPADAWGTQRRQIIEILDEHGACIFHDGGPGWRGVDFKRTAGFRVAVECGWIDERGRDLLHR